MLKDNASNEMPLTIPAPKARHAIKILLEPHVAGWLTDAHDASMLVNMLELAIGQWSRLGREDMVSNKVRIRDTYLDFLEGFHKVFDLMCQDADLSTRTASVFEMYCLEGKDAWQIQKELGISRTSYYRAKTSCIDWIINNPIALFMLADEEGVDYGD